MIQKICKYLSNPDYRFLVNCSLGFHRGMPNEKYLKKVYFARLGKKLHLNPPVTFNEKIQWLKLNDNRAEYAQMVDKAAVKQYVAAKIGESYIIPTIGIYDTLEDIDFSVLPSQFVLKCTHDSGGLVICRDKESFDKKAAKQTLRRFLKRDYYSQWRESPYKDVQHKIIAEPYLDAGANGMTDYKIHCFNGVPKLILVCSDRLSKSGLTEDFFTPDWTHLELKRPKVPNASSVPDKPEKLDEMLLLAQRLAKDIPFVRIDFYILNHQVLFSEITFYPASGLTAFEPDEWDKIMGEWLTLPGYTL